MQKAVIKPARKARSDIGFTAVNWDGQMLLWSTAAYATGVRKSVGEAYADQDQNWREGWQNALRYGVRVCKVRLVPRRRRK